MRKQTQAMKQVLRTLMNDDDDERRRFYKKSSKEARRPPNKIHKRGLAAQEDRRFASKEALLPLSINHLHLLLHCPLVCSSFPSFFMHCCHSLVCSLDSIDLHPCSFFSLLLLPSHCYYYY